MICAGGGGIPTAYAEDGQLVGVEAVIDKDHASGLLARDLDADVFVMATDTSAAFVGFGSPAQARSWRATRTRCSLSHRLGVRRRLDAAEGPGRL